MQFTESSSRQAEHFEWLNAIDFYQSYLEIMEQRLFDMTRYNGEIDKNKVSAYQDMLDYLKERLSDLHADVIEHVAEIETGDGLDNRLEMTSQSAHHFGLKEKFELFEEMLNGFRTEFNSFYVNNI